MVAEISSTLGSAHSTHRRNRMDIPKNNLRCLSIRTLCLQRFVMMLLTHAIPQAVADDDHCRIIFCRMFSSIQASKSAERRGDYKKRLQEVGKFSESRNAQKKLQEALNRYTTIQLFCLFCIACLSRVTASFAHLAPMCAYRLNCKEIALFFVYLT